MFLLGPSVVQMDQGQKNIPKQSSEHSVVLSFSD